MIFKWKTSFLTSTMLLGLSLTGLAQNLLLNPGCEELIMRPQQGGELQGIALGNYGDSKGELKPEHLIVKSGKTAARLEKFNQHGWSGIVFSSKSFSALKEPEMLEVSLFLKTDTDTRAYLVLTTNAAEQHQYFWKELQAFKSIFDWTEVKHQVIIPAGSTKVQLSIRLSGDSGVLYADDVNIVKQNSELPLIFNPGFEERVETTEKLPQGWQRRDFEGLETDVAIQVVSPGVEGKNAVQLVWRSGGSKAGLSTGRLQIGQQKKMRLSVKSKSDGDSQALLLVEFFNRQGAELKAVSSEPVESRDWQNLSLAFEVPEEAVTLSFVLVLQGQSKVWFDQLQIVGSGNLDSVDPALEAECFPLNSVSIWNGSPVFSTFVDSPSSLSFQFRGRVRELNNPALVLELPEELTVAQCFQSHTDLNDAVPAQVESGLSNGVPCRRFRFLNPRIFSMIQANYRWRRTLTLALRPTRPNLEEQEFKATWYLENDGKYSKKQEFMVKILPPLPDQTMPKQFYAGIWSSYSMDFPDAELFQQVTAKYRKANLIGRTRYRTRNSQDEQLRQQGWHLFGSGWNADYGFGHSPASWLQEIPDYDYVIKAMRFRTMTNGINVSTGKLCPEFFLHDQRYHAFVKLALRRRLAGNGVQDGEVLLLDSEPWSPSNWCLDEECRKAFAHYAALPETPSATEIKECHAEKWRDFRVQQSTETMRLLTELHRSVYPNSPILDYDYPINFDAPNFEKYFYSCAKDSRANDAFIDGHIQSYYHILGKKAFDMIQINMRHLKKSYHVIIAIDGIGYLSKKEIINPLQFQQAMLSAAALGVKSVCIYCTSEIDGRFFQACQQAMAKIAQMEKFFWEGNRLQLELFPDESLKTTNDNLRYTIHRLNKQILLSFFNYNPEEPLVIPLSTAVFQEKLQVADFLGRQPFAVSDKGNYQVEISPQGARFLLLEAK